MNLENASHPLESRSKQHTEYVDSWRISGNESPEVRGIIESFDFNLLRDIFLRIAKQSGIEIENFNFVDSQQILCADDARLHWNGLYEQQPNVIKVNRMNLDIDLENFLQKNKDEICNAETYQAVLKLALLAVVVHEEAHAVTHRSCEEWIDDPRVDFGKDLFSYKGGYFKRLKSGYTQKDIEEMVRSNFRVGTYFQLFNEGVVEKISKEVFYEYIKTSGMVTQAELEIFKRFYQKKGSYVKVVELIDALIKKISVSQGQPAGTVWHAFIRSALQGDDLDSKDIAELFSSAAGRETFEKIKQLVVGEEDTALEIKKYLEISP